MSTYVFTIPLLVGVLIILKEVYKRAKYASLKRRYRITKNDMDKHDWLTVWMLQKKMPAKIVKHFAVRIGIISGYSYVKNSNLVVRGSLIGIGLTIALYLALILNTKELWYVIFIYSILFITIIGIFVNVISEYLKGRFTAKIPDIYKIINVRYASTKDIIKTLEISMSDFDKSVRKEMLQIYNTLRKNNMNEIVESFRLLEQAYDDRYLTILLNLIEHAYYKGGTEAISEQLEKTLEEALINAENQKDLKAAANGYILMSLLVPISIYGIEQFNQYALQDSAGEYYSNPQGLQIKIVVILMALIYAFVMNYYKKLY